MYIERYCYRVKNDQLQLCGQFKRMRTLLNCYNNIKLQEIATDWQIPLQITFGQ